MSPDAFCLTSVISKYVLIVNLLQLFCNLRRRHARSTTCKQLAVGHTHFRQKFVCIFFTEPLPTGMKIDALSPFNPLNFTESSIECNFEGKGAMEKVQSEELQSRNFFVGQC